MRSLLPGSPSNATRVAAVAIVVALASCLWVEAAPAGVPAFPLKLSPNHRYLVDQRGAPFMIVGDSPHSLIGNLGVRNAARYIADRRAAGFNTLWVELLCVKYTGCREDGTTYDGIAPFTQPGDLSTPDPAYFARADAIIRLAARAGMVVLLDPIETGGWLNVLKSNGVGKDKAYGRFLGLHYKHFANIVWLSGNDFQTWQSADDDRYVLAVAQGIKGADPQKLQTVELNYPVSSSRDDARWRSILTLDAAYTYAPTYAEVTKEYNRKPPLPVFMAEAGYEFEQNSSTISKGDPPTLRRQEYWSMLGGAAGQMYGNHYTWTFADGWKQHLDTPGSKQMGYLVRLFASLPWWRLVPDQKHAVVTAAYGTFATSGSVNSSDYVTTAATPDRRLAVSYLPSGGTITVDTTHFAGRVRARWYDPTVGRYAGPGSTAARATRVTLTTPGRNASGDPDWVLVLTAQSVR